MQGMLMKYVVVLPLIMTILSSAQSTAGTKGAMTTEDWRWVGTFTVGPDFINSGETQTLSLLPPFQNTYTKGSASQAIADVGGFIGIEQKFNKKLSAQLGISGYVDAQITPKGTIWQFTRPEFEDLSYAYHIHHRRVMATSKLLTTISQYPRLLPYISGEIGAAFNHTGGYQEMPLEAGVLPMLPFTDHNQTSFAWSVGVGFDYNLGAHARVGIGYQFSDLGSVSLGPTPASLTTQTLSLSHIYANQLRFQLTILV